MKVSDVTVGDEGWLARGGVVAGCGLRKSVKLNSESDGMKTCFQDTKVYSLIH